jgi:hypothetical protein
VLKDIDVSLREHMFLSGVFTDMSAIGEILPDEVLIWMLDHSLFLLIPYYL